MMRFMRVTCGVVYRIFFTCTASACESKLVGGDGGKSFVKLKEMGTDLASFPS